MWQKCGLKITNVKSVKCLKQVLRCASSWSFIITWKCEWYMCAYTLKRRLKIVLTTSRKLGGKGVPMVSEIGTKTHDQRLERPKSNCSFKCSTLQRTKKFTKLLRKCIFIVELGFYPIHQVLHVFWCRHLDRPLDLDSISPSILIPAYISFQLDILQCDTFFNARLVIIKLAVWLYWWVQRRKIYCTLVQLT